MTFVLDRNTFYLFTNFSGAEKGSDTRYEINVESHDPGILSVPVLSGIIPDRYFTNRDGGGWNSSREDEMLGSS